MIIKDVHTFNIYWNSESWTDPQQVQVYFLNYKNTMVRYSLSKEKAMKIIVECYCLSTSGAVTPNSRYNISYDSN